MSKSGWIGVDLDGTLAEYHGWGDGSIGKPIPAMVERVKRWIAEGNTVKIMTARCWPFGTNASAETHRVLDSSAQIDAITAWLIEHIGQPLEITCVKDYAMIELWDDRAVQVIPNTGQPVGESTRGLK